MTAAIIGMAGRLPEAADLRQFRANLTAGRDSIREINVLRRTRTGVSADETLPPIAFVDGIDEFDYRFFRLSRAEARNIDPQHRLLLQTTVHALESACYSLDRLSGTATGIYLAGMRAGYAALIDPSDPTSIIGVMPSIAAGRIARFLDTRGPAMVIDTACSSTLVALAAALRDLADGRCDFAIVAAANIRATTENFSAMTASGIFSPTFKARSFSDDADGTGCGEAVGVLLLRRSSDAERDGDVVHAVVRSVATNQDGGRSATLTAPDAVAQSDVIQAAWREAAIDPAELVAIEAHGSATRLGDPIEIHGLNLAFSARNRMNAACPVTSVKANIGHCDTAAGMAGLLRTVLTVKHRELYPAVNFSAPNPLIPFEDSAVYVNTAFRRLTDDAVPIAGCSSFSIVGTNAHAVLSAPLARPAHAAGGGPYPILLSAADPVSLDAMVDDLARWLAATPDADLRALSDVLLHGRSHFTHRRAILANDRDDLLAQLAQPREAVRVEPDAAGFVLVFSEIAPGAEAVAALLARDPAFAVDYELAEGNAAGSTVSFPFTYALYRRLEAAGMQITASIAEGAGKLALDVVKGQLPLAVAIARSRSAPPSPTPSRERMLALLAQLEPGTRFVEMGPLGHLSTVLRDVMSDESGRRLLALGDDLDPTGLLVRVYGAGAPFKTRAKPHLADLDLPGYPFRPEPCWPAVAARSTAGRDVAAPAIADWLHRLVWRPPPVGRGEPIEEGRHYALVGIDSPLRKALRATLIDRGAVVTCHPDVTAFVPDDRTIIDLTAVDLGSACTDTDVADRLEAVFQPFAAAFARVSEDLGRRAYRYVGITLDAQRVMALAVVDPAAAAILSLWRSALVEQPRADLVAIDVTAADLAEMPERVAACIVEGLAGRYQQRLLAVRDARCLVPVLEPLPEPPTPLAPRIIRSAVISGGSSGLGLELACHLGAKGNCRLLLIGRRPILGSEARRRLDDLATVGSSVDYVSADLTQPGAIAALSPALARFGGVVDCLVHAAGIAGRGDAPAARLSPDVFRETYAGKVIGALHLRQALAGIEIGREVAFSSLAAMVPPRDRADYACANAILDALGGRTVSIRWAPWTGFDMGRNEETGPRAHELSLRTGLAIFDRLSSGDEVLPVAARLDMAYRFNPFFTIAGLSDQRVEGVCPDPMATAQERALWEVWRDVMGQADFDLDTDFYAMGGHSLIAVQLLDQIDLRIGVLLKLEDLLACPTVRGMARHIGTLDSGPAKPIPKTGEADRHPASDAQIGLWLQAQKTRDSRAFNEVLAYEVTGPLDPGRLAAMIACFVDAQEALRTTLHYVNGEVVQRVHALPTVENYFSVVDAVPDETIGSRALTARILASVDLQFALDRLPLLHLTMIRLGPDQSVITIVSHHIVSDGWSNKVMLHDLLADEGAAPRASARITYRDYAHWQRDLADSPEGLARIAFWVRELEGYRPAALPYDGDAAGKRTSRGRRLAVDCPPGLYARIAAGAQRLSVSSYAFVLTLVAGLIGRWSACDDLVLLSPVHGRQRRELRGLVGCFTNLLPLRFHLDRDSRLADVILDVWRRERDWLANQDAPFHKVTAASPVGADIHRLGFTWDADEVDTMDNADLSVRRLPIAIDHAKAHLWVYGRVVDGEVSFEIEYAEDLFDEPTIRFLSRRLVTLLDRSLDILDRPLGAIDLSIEPENRSVTVALAL